MRVTLLVSIFLIAVPFVQADDQLRATQEELRRRNLYFGEIDGRPTGELSEALRHFQQRKGYNATGRTDPATLRLLGLLPRDGSAPPPRESSLPDEPVLKSDIPISPLAEARAVSQETGIALSELAPVAEQAAGKPGKHRHSTPARPPSGGGSGGGQPLTQAPPTKGVGLRGAPQGSLLQRLDPAQLAPLIRGYLHAAAGDDARAELRFLADRVDYLGHGLMDRRVIEHTLRSYYLRWPGRSYKLAGPVDYRHDRVRGVFVVSFVVDFELRRGSVKAKGSVTNRFVFDGGTSDPRIISIQEERVRAR